ncbi:DUF6286 domain-containing protein [Mycetocola miduiensis]|uniref:DUF6286 domain-containing protein n=1 Tax=Mycetocola miduiensis TaxID=995034 RepID=A0A1I4ZW48_9MICO|nr:DUF6286 domain-containing protein [Mycetocola miduiensis]SFN54240.1 hypothetical protein SAMN05216219_1113 [Mycetocola miduiensis]
MSSRRSTYQRIRRRETRSPRSVAAIILAIVLISTFAWLAVEIVLGMLNRPPILVAPSVMATALVEITSLPAASLVGGGLVIALTGWAFIALAVTPGRRGRHILESTHTVILVDDDVIASALARHAASAAGIGLDQVRVTVSRKRVEVRLTPTSGILLDRTAVLNVVTDELDSYQLQPTLEPPRLSIAREGKVGA